MPIQEIRRANLQRLVDVSSVSDVANVYKVPLVTWNTAASPTPTVTEVLQ